MLGLRGVCLGIQIPELTTMQVRAIFEAACMVTKEGVEVHPEIMIPLTSHVNELKAHREILEVEAKKVMREQSIEIDYKFGTMIEIPRAALTAHQLAEHAEFFSFGTNDLTQTTFGMSRDDEEAGFLIRYLRTGILPENPFATLDRDGVGQLMALCAQKARLPGRQSGWFAACRPGVKVPLQGRWRRSSVCKYCNRTSCANNCSEYRWTNQWTCRLNPESIQKKPVL